MTDGVLSLTKHYVLERLVDEIAQVRPGMSIDEVRATLESPHVELADDLFQYEDGQLVDSMLLEACRSGAPGSVRLVWVALVAADGRLQNFIADYLTDADGLIDPNRYSRVGIQGYLETVLDGGTQKAASNLAHYFEQARILVPIKTGPQIVGVSHYLDTRSAVPLAAAYLAERYGWDDPLQGALDKGANAWLNLDAEDFADAWENVPEERAGGDPVAGLPSAKQPKQLPPTDLDKPYVDEDENAGINFTGRREFDPEVLERASMTHRKTQNAVAQWARDNGYEPLRPTGSPKFDAAWWEDDVLRLVEVKSVRAENEANQVRLGLGQLLDYRLRLESHGVDVSPVLALSEEPTDTRWSDLCAQHGIVLTWPPFDQLN
jgi:hypothetical protein